MPYIFDMVIIAIIVVCVIRGVKKGFIKSAFSILTFLLAALLSFMFYVPFSEYVTNTPTGQSVSKSLEESIYKTLAGTNDKDDITKSDENDSADTFGSTTEEIINKMNIPSFMFGSVFAQSDFLMRTARVSAAQAVSNSLANAFMKLICGVILFLLSLICLWIIRRLLELLFKLPLLKEVNKFAGFIAGLVNGVLISYLVIAVCVSLSGFDELSFIKNTTQQSYIYKNFYQTNIIAEMFLK